MKSYSVAAFFWVKDVAVVLTLLFHCHGHVALSVYVPLGFSVSAE